MVKGDNKMFVLERQFDFVDNDVATFKWKEYYNKSWKQNNPYGEWVITPIKDCWMPITIYDYITDMWKLYRIKILKTWNVIWTWCHMCYKGQQLDGYYIRVLDIENQSEVSVLDLVKNGQFVGEFKL
jgi:hypothetical protein